MPSSRPSTRTAWQACQLRMSLFLLQIFYLFVNVKEMTVCSLGKDAGWDDPTKIPIEDIIELWREQSSKGRYANSLY